MVLRVAATDVTRARRRQQSRDRNARALFATAKNKRYGQLAYRVGAVDTFLSEAGHEGAFDEWLDDSAEFKAEMAAVEEDPEQALEEALEESKELYEQDMATLQEAAEAGAQAPEEQPEEPPDVDEEEAENAD